MSGEGSSNGSAKRLPRGVAGGLLDLGFHTSAQDRADSPGDLIARYRLVAPLGEGGFGVVWSASQVDPIQREIALKLIKRGMDSCEIIARFQAESQALARMDHPNIAAVLDAGTAADGRPFFAMELVKGCPLNTYCDSRNLTVRERLELFIPVCQAVQHAHQKAILHRDLKPSNILIMEVDGKPVPKVIDFGIAKALGTPQEAALQGSLLQTRAGSIVGTLHYMSPEQAGSVPDVDTRSDIYSLGVILHELLTGQTPLSGFSNLPHEEMLRCIREEESAKPSTRISSAHADLRRSDPARLRRLLRGDLDWIILKALEKDRRRRYETATALGTDLKRFLNEEPVSAGAPTWSYQFSKFASRNRIALTAAGIVFLTLLAATAVSLWQAAEARKASASAEAHRIEAEEDSRRARDAVEVFLSHVTENTGLKSEVFQKLRKELLESALPFYEQMGKTKGRDPAFRADQAWAFGRLGAIYRETGEREKGITPIRQAVDLMEQLVKEVPENQIYRRSLVMHLNNLCVLLRESGKHAESVEIQKRSLVVAENLARDFPDNDDYRKDLTILLVNFGQALAEAGKMDDAEVSLKRAVELRQALADKKPASTNRLNDVASAHADLACFLYSANNSVEAEPHFRQALLIQEKLAADPASRAEARQNLANSYYNFSHFLNRFKNSEKAIIYGRRSVELNRKLAEETPSDVGCRHSLGISYYGIGDTLVSLGKTGEAEDAFKEALEVLRVLAAEFPDNFDNLYIAGRSADRLGALKRDAGDYQAARGFYQETLSLQRKALKGRPDNKNYRIALADALMDVGEACFKLGDAKEMIVAALELPRYFPNQWAEHEKAAQLIERAIPILEKDANPETRAAAIESASLQAIDFLKSSIALGNLTDYDTLFDRFPSLRANAGFTSMESLLPDAEDRSPSSFTFDYQDDDPGKRQWKRDGDSWLEVKPSGKTSYFKITQRVRALGISGTEVEKTGESNRWFFIPDKGTAAPSRLLMRTSPGKWANIGKIADMK
ncbi:MAG: tetratricopeptide repeat protein [Chthoniobacteraceae bacterium]|nr:tetratricopeptide repeat protein [Chthoniobacteraceae bacterium]